MTKAELIQYVYVHRASVSLGTAGVLHVAMRLLGRRGPRVIDQREVFAHVRESWAREGENELEALRRNMRKRIRRLHGKRLAEAITLDDGGDNWWKASLNGVTVWIDHNYNHTSSRYVATYLTRDDKQDWWNLRAALIEAEKRATGVQS